MTSVFDLYGYGVPPYGGDSIDASTADVAALYDQKQRYGNSLFGRIDNWLRQKQSQPNQLASDASLWDQAAEAGNRLAHLPVDMLIAGSRTANNWAGSPQFPERVEPGDMLAPLGIGAMAGLGGALKGAALRDRAQATPTARTVVTPQDVTIAEPVSASQRFRPGDTWEMRSPQWPTSWFEEYHGDGSPPTKIPRSQWDEKTIERAKLFVRDQIARDKANEITDELMWDGRNKVRERWEAEAMAIQDPSKRQILDDAYSARQNWYEHDNPKFMEDPLDWLSYPLPPGTNPAAKIDEMFAVGGKPPDRPPLRDISSALDAPNRMIPDTIPASYFDDIMPAAGAGRAATDLTVPQNRLARAANDGDDGPLRGNYPAPGNLPLRPSEASSVSLTEAYERYAEKAFQRGLQPDSFERFREAVIDAGIVPQRQAGRSVLPGVELFADQSRASLPGLVSGALDLDNAGGSLTAGRAATPQEMPDALNYPANSLSPSQPRAGQMADGQQGRMPDAAGQPAPAGRSAIADDPLLGPSINSMLDLRRMIDDEGQYFVRWSRGPEYDLAAGATSKDYQTGKLHSGLSAEEISKELSDHDLFNLLKDYSFLRSPSNPAKPHIYSGKVVGQDSDGASSIRPKKHVGSLSDEFISRLDDESISDRLKLMDKVSVGRRILSGDNRNGPQSFYDRVAKELEANEKLLNDAGGPVVLANQSRASLPGLFAGAVDEPKGITAYHGSPHDFDRFDMSKIGTGEGAQAYGHGLYFAENESVARSYKDELGGGGSKIVADSPISGELRAWLDKYPDVDVARMMLEMRRDKPGVSELIDEINRLSGARAVPSNGHLYEVRINADPEDFLDWDKPLSQQSENAFAAIQNVLPEYPRRILGPTGRIEEIGKGLPVPDTTVEQFMTTLPSKEAATALREAGIPGIRYLDQGSRFAGDGSRNYVLFRDDIIEIVKKYGIAAAASMYGMSAVDEAMASEGP